MVATRARLRSQRTGSRRSGRWRPPGRAAARAGTFGAVGRPPGPGRRGPRGPKKDQIEWMRLDSPGQIGAPFPEGKQGWTSGPEGTRIRPSRLRFPPLPVEVARHLVSNPLLTLCARPVERPRSPLGVHACQGRPPKRGTAGTPGLLAVLTSTPRGLMWPSRWGQDRTLRGQPLRTRDNFGTLDREGTMDEQLKGAPVIGIWNQTLLWAVDELIKLGQGRLTHLKVRSGEHLAAILATSFLGVAPFQVDSDGGVDLVFQLPAKKPTPPFFSPKDPNRGLRGQVHARPFPQTEQHDQPYRECRGEYRRTRSRHPSQNSA